jgi:hypothetical protein
MAHNIFISYSSVDKIVADAVCATLENRKIRCWIAPRDVLPGVSYAEALIEAINQSHLFVLVLSKNSNNSLQVMWEVEQAVKKGIQILPLESQLQNLADFVRTPNTLPKSTRTPLPILIEIIQDIFFRKEEMKQNSSSRKQREKPQIDTREHHPLDSKGKSNSNTLHRNTVAEEKAGRRFSKHTSTPDIPGGRAHLVHFTVTSPPNVLPESRFIVSVWTHLGNQRQEVVQRAHESAANSDLNITSQGPVEVEHNTVLTVRPELDDFIVEASEATIFWEGEIGNASFRVKVTRNSKPGPRVGIATIYIKGLQIAVIYFTLHLGNKSKPVKELNSKIQLHRWAFIFYADEDINDVTMVIIGLQKGAPSIQVIFDKNFLRSGQNWWPTIKKAIPTVDIFNLFWSAYACKSKWVEEEWRYALKKRGLNFISPCPLVSPKNVPSPTELDSMQFDEHWRAYQQSKSNHNLRNITRGSKCILSVCL